MVEAVVGYIIKNDIPDACRIRTEMYWDTRQLVVV